MAEETIYQLHLSGFGMSGRGVRLRQLEPALVHQVEEDAAKLMGPGATAYAFNQAVLAEGVSRMVAEITEPVMGVREVVGDEAEPGAKPAAPVPRTPNDPDVEWRPVTLQQMKASAASWFTARDVAVLEQMYARLHQVSQLEIDAIMGKALPVTR